MPLYTWVCDHCREAETGFAKIAQRDEPRQHRCGLLMQRTIVAPAVRPEIQPYRSPIDGKWVDSRAQRREDLKRNNCVEWHPELRQEAAQNRKEAEEKRWASIEKTMLKTACEMLN